MSFLLKEWEDIVHVSHEINNQGINTTMTIFMRLIPIKTYT